MASQLVLYHARMSFYSQRAVLALHEKGLSFSSKLVDLSSGEQYSDWYLKLNPRALIPTLADGETVVADSGNIIDYLDGCASSGPSLGCGTENVERLWEIVDGGFVSGVVTYGSLLHPELTADPEISPKERATRLEILPKVDDYLREALVKHPELRDLLDAKRIKNDAMKKIRDRGFYEECLKRVGEMLDRVEEELARCPDQLFLCSDEFTKADIALAVALKRLKVTGLWHRFFPQASIYKPHLLGYWTRVSSREAFKKTFPHPPTLRERHGFDA